MNLSRVGEAYRSTPRVVPRATYRLQLSKHLPFARVRQIVPYLARLGVSHLYLSPIFSARRGSIHGYDVTDHASVNPELGGEEEFDRLCSAVKSHGMGVILDIVPNHMAIMADGNHWWFDVLENGPAAEFAHYFDIDWSPLRETMRNRLLVPILGNRFGEELSNGRLQLRFDALKGEFEVHYAQHRFPIDPREYPQILALPETITLADEQRRELKRIADEFRELPTRSEQSMAGRLLRYKRQIELKQSLAMLARNKVISSAIDSAVRTINGTPSDPESYTTLTKLLNTQPYRLAYWRVAADEINYRRFFDVNSLAALRVEDHDVFLATHNLVKHLLEKDGVDGLRIDHVDGLFDPESYLRQLRSLSPRSNDIYLVVEKILASHEKMRPWPIQGTTGYDYGAQVVAWLHADKGNGTLTRTYRRFLRDDYRSADIRLEKANFDRLVRQCKRLLMKTSLAGEVTVLAMQLDRIAQAHRDTVDFTQLALREAIVDVIAAFPVYRTYISADGVNAEDRRAIKWAVGIARSRYRGADRSILDFIQSVLLCELTTDPIRAEAVLNFVMKFQQVTSPVMAKAVEDTSFYRYGRLLSLNEVGGDPRVTSLSTVGLHKANKDRSEHWPHGLLATSTHDSKRGEDVRYRLAVLSEAPHRWRRFAVKAARLNRLNHKVHSVSGDAIPTRHDEYVVLQTLLGIWPATPQNPEDCMESLASRLKEYAVKAAREAKDRSSWLSPDIEYEEALSAFIDGYFTTLRWPTFNALIDELADFVAFFGIMNSIAALTLKLTAPGIPDFYQGSELAELHLVDPDNRRPVDFDLRASMLATYCNSADGVEPAIAAWRSGAIKLFVMQRLLKLRTRYTDLFRDGDYQPLTVTGDFADHVCAFARQTDRVLLVAIVCRWMATLLKEAAVPTNGSYWQDTNVELPSVAGTYKFVDAMTGKAISSSTASRIRLADVCSALPIAVFTVELAS